MIGNPLSLLLTLAAAWIAPGATAVDTAFETEPPRSAIAKDPCCFNNPAYSGTCRVDPAEDETCESILTYLNNPMSQGKSYCGSTRVRQGWQQVTCEEAESPTAGIRIHRRECYRR